MVDPAFRLGSGLGKSGQVVFFKQCIHLNSRELGYKSPCWKPYNLHTMGQPSLIAGALLLKETCEPKSPPLCGSSWARLGGDM